jgi:radical SAM-linked protein
MLAELKRSWMVVFVKVRMKFEKGDEVKYISHLDMMRTFERSLRRAKLPIAFTKGFNPRPKLTFSQALPVGVTSSSEFVDVEFNEKVEIDDVICRLNKYLPRGFLVKYADFCNNDFPLHMLNCAKYIAKIAINKNSQIDIEKVISNILARKQIIIEKQSKSRKRLIDIAPLIYDIYIKEFKDEICLLCLELSIGQDGNVTPEMLISILNENLERNVSILLINREEMYLREGEKITYPL